MKLIVCLDDSNGMMFNNRRCSRDRELNKYIAQLVGSSPFWLTPYSYELFADLASTLDIRLCDSYCDVPAGHYCFAEDAELPSGGAEEVIVAYWNRSYPADKYFSLDTLDGFKLIKSDEIVGSSHDKITIEYYEK